MSKKKELIPELRFPEFVNEGEWEKKKLGDLGHFLGGGTPDRSNSSYWTGDIPWISSSDIKEDDIHNISITRFINDNSIKESATKIIPKGSVMFVSRVGVGKLAINKEELCTSQDFTSFVPKKDVLNFLIGYYFSSNKNLLQSLNQGTSIKGFSKSDLEDFKLSYPKNPKEQQKIASCLSSLDEVIAAHSKKLDLLKDHKKGLMQNLFPQEGEKVPKYRFPKYVNAGEWVKKELSDFCFNISSGKNKNCEGGKFELYGSTGIIGKTENPSYNGDYILVARVGANAGLLNRVKGNFGVTDNTLVIDLKKIGSTDFIYYSLEKTDLNKLVFGSGQPLITGGQLRSLILFISKSDKEQQKIASCLSIIDDLITGQMERIEQLKLHKKGLMQKLFPKIKE
jgi:type I restriction enzyme S subunit